jgi:nicotinamide mononucleotide adenylyltransferase
MLGSFHPFHSGHRELFEKSLAKHGQVAILIRDMPITESNPLQQDDIATNIEKELYEYAGKFRIYAVPNIIGRTLGDKIE